MATRKIEAVTTVLPIGEQTLRVSYDYWPEEPETETDPRQPAVIEVNLVEFPGHSGWEDITDLIVSLDAMDTVTKLVSAGHSSG